MTDCPTNVGFFGLSDNDVSSPTSRHESKGQHSLILQLRTSTTPSTLNELARKLWKLLTKAMQ
eukprot:1336447-Amorphochlora_amoeboformis.AAC.1